MRAWLEANLSENLDSSDNVQVDVDIVEYVVTRCIAKDPIHAHVDPPTRMAA